MLLDVQDCSETLAMIGAIKNMNQPLSDVAMYIHCDISNECQVKKAIGLAIEHYEGPKIDILVNNACSFVFKSVEDASVEDFKKSMNVNILGHALVTKYCLPYMKNASATPGYGSSIIFQGSISSFRGQPNCATCECNRSSVICLSQSRFPKTHCTFLLKTQQPRVPLYSLLGTVPMTWPSTTFVATPFVLAQSRLQSQNKNARITDGAMRNGKHSRRKMSCSVALEHHGRLPVRQSFLLVTSHPIVRALT